jgi:hypothetical protein
MESAQCTRSLKLYILKLPYNLGIWKRSGTGFQKFQLIFRNSLCYKKNDSQFLVNISFLLSTCKRIQW